jgi:hypothetical protein
LFALRKELAYGSFLRILALIDNIRAKIKAGGFDFSFEGSGTIIEC